MTPPSASEQSLAGKRRPVVVLCGNLPRPGLGLATMGQPDQLPRYVILAGELAALLVDPIGAVFIRRRAGLGIRRRVARRSARRQMRCRTIVTMVATHIVALATLTATALSTRRPRSSNSHSAIVTLAPDEQRVEGVPLAGVRAAEQVGDVGHAVTRLERHARSA